MRLIIVEDIDSPFSIPGAEWKRLKVADSGWRGEWNKFVVWYYCKFLAVK